jgi:ATPases involved in chromosome partitioning
MIITVSSLKGGVGKTTLTAFLAQALKAMGKKVLVVDLDHNNNLTDYALREVGTEQIEARNIRQVLTHKATAQECIWSGRESRDGISTMGPFGDIIPATPSLAQVGYELAMDGGAVLRFRKNMRDLECYDFVLIDTPPSLCIELSAGLYAADMVLVPVSASRWTVQGYQVIEAEVVKIGDTLGKAPRMLAVPSMVSESEAETLREVEIWKATATSIRRDPSIRAAASEGRALREGTIAAEAFRALAEEVVG